MEKKSKMSMFPRGFKMSALLACATLGMAACSSDSGDNATDDLGGTPTGPATTATMTSATSATTGTTATVATVASSATVGTTTNTSATSGTTGTTGTTTSTSTSTTAGSTTNTGTTGMGTMGTGAGGMSSSGSMSGSGGAGGTGTTGGELFDVTPEDFTCIRDWERVSGFRITNVLGEAQTAEAIAVAQNPAGGVYPVGTIIQHLPTEAMVKRYEGFSPETRDWEFFLLQLSADGASISQRGTTEITTMGNTCVSCHSDVAPEFDFICNTWADATDSDCGFDFTDQQLNANDPRCN